MKNRTTKKIGHFLVNSSLIAARILLIHFNYFFERHKLILRYFVKRKKAPLMKKAIFLFFAFVICSIVTKAQDIITLTDGSQIQAKVLEINPSDIKYKDFNNPDGPVITIRKDGVSMIQYANGTKTLFNDPYNKNQTPATPYNRNPGKSSENDRKPYNSSGQGYRKRSGRDARLSGWYFGAGLSFGISNATNTDPTYTTAGSRYSGLTIAATKMFNQHIGIQF